MKEEEISRDALVRMLYYETGFFFLEKIIVIISIRKIPNLSEYFYQLITKYTHFFIRFYCILILINSRFICIDFEKNRNQGVL